MSFCRLARGITSLVFDAVEAVVFLFDWSDPADKLWADACDRLVEKEAEEEVAEPGRGGGNDVSQGAEPSSGTLWEADSHGQAIAQAFTAINQACSECARIVKSSPYRTRIKAAYFGLYDPPFDSSCMTEPKSSERDCSPSGAPSAGSATTGEPNTVATAAKVPSGSEIRAHSPEGHLTSSPAPASAGDEHSGGSVPRSDVEPPESLILLTAKDIDDAAYAIWRHAETQDGAIRESWHQLADKFETTANAMK